MTKFEENVSPYLSFVEGSAPSSPAATNFKLYYDSADHLPKWKNSAGTVFVVPGIQMSYVEFTSDVTITATTEATANTIVTAAALAGDGVTPFIIEFFSPLTSTNTTSGHATTFYLYDGASSIGYHGQLLTPAAAVMRAPVYIRRRITPSNASHTYSMRATTTGGSPFVGGGAGGNGTEAPGFIRITTA